MATSSVSLHKTTGLRIVFFGVKRQSCSESENCSLSESIDMQKTNANLYIVLVYGFGSDRKLLGTGISEYHRYHYGYCYCRNVIMSQLPDDPASELQSLPNRARLCHTCVWLPKTYIHRTDWQYLLANRKITSSNKVKQCLSISALLDFDKHFLFRFLLLC